MNDTNASDAPTVPPSVRKAIAARSWLHAVPLRTTNTKPRYSIDPSEALHPLAEPGFGVYARSSTLSRPEQQPGGLFD